MKKLTLAAIAAALVGSMAPASADLTIPLLSYRTGPYAPNGIPYADGVTDYINMINARDGGVGGVPINLLECETGYNTERGVECYESTKGQGSLVYFPLSTGITYQLIPKATADGPDEMRKLARLNLLEGADWLKTCASGGGGTDKEEPTVRNHTQEELDTVCDEAHALHAYCSIHCFTPDAHRMALKAGADTIEHMVFHDQDSLEKLVESQVPVTPTLSHRTDHAIEIRREIGTPSFTLEKMKRIQPDCFKTFQAFYKAGVKIAMGTDMGFEPDIGSNADELKIYVDLGMKPMDAIMTITKNAAEALHIDKELGTLDEGKLADVVLVKGNPAENVEVLGKRENILMVLKEGKICVDRSNGKDVKPFPTNYREWKMMD